MDKQLRLKMSHIERSLESAALQDEGSFAELYFQNSAEIAAYDIEKRIQVLERVEIKRLVKQVKKLKADLEKKRKVLVFKYCHNANFNICDYVLRNEIRAAME